VLYRGIGMSIINMGVLTGVQFPITGSASQLITGGVARKLSDNEKVAAGFIGGAVSGVICAPMELIMIQQQRHGGSLLHQGGRILGEFGAPGLFRGLVTSCGREGFFTAGYLGLGPVFAEKLSGAYPGLQRKASDFLGASCAGMIAATLSHPLDTIKTCMQGDVERRKFGSLGGTARTLLREEGAGRFFSGWGWRTVNCILAIFIIGQLKDSLAPVLFPHHFQRRAAAPRCELAAAAATSRSA